MIPSISIAIPVFQQQHGRRNAVEQGGPGAISYLYTPASKKKRTSPLHREARRALFISLLPGPLGHF